MKAHNKHWWVWFASGILILVWLRLALNGMAVETRKNILFQLSFLVLIFFIAYRFIILRKAERGTPEYYNYLPFYPCNILTFILPLAIFYNSFVLDSVIMLFGSTFPLLAILMPTSDCDNIPVKSIECIGFYVSHYGVWILSVIYGSFIKPHSPTWILVACIAYVVILLLEHLINVWFRKTNKYPDANYGFTMATENNPVFNAAYNKLPHRYFYLYLLIPPFAVIGLIFHYILTHYIH